jgi:hypothetical protein
LFWDFDAIGHVAMGVASLVAVYFYPTFSTNLLFLGFPWTMTAPLFMLMLALMLRSKGARDVG